MSEGSSYRAPALEKGLDILELVARETAPLTLVQISDRLNRSKGEIFRMLQVLEERGYIARAPGLDGYSITNRLFMLGMVQPPVRDLLDVALPTMQRLAQEIWQSCHLVVASEDDIVVIARVESPSDVGYVVRVGHKRPIVQAASGAVIFAHQSAELQDRWLARLFPADGSGKKKFLERVETVRAQGYARIPSARVDGVTDLSAPIIQDGRAVATVTVPFAKQDPQERPIDEAVERLVDAAGQISTALRFGPSMVLAPTLPVSETQKDRKAKVRSAAGAGA
jgi:DNA-binding IclR family transcriptional regulator